MIYIFQPRYNLLNEAVAEFAGEYMFTEGIVEPLLARTKSTSRKHLGQASKMRDESSILA